MTTVRLEGCRTEPLGSYLKALGVLRLVGEQVDREATGCWSGDVLVLDSVLDADGLADFLVDEYRPTPLVAPWNGRSGFRTDVRRPSEDLLSEFERVDEPRLRPFQAAIAAGRVVYEHAEKSEWDPKKQKDLWVQACRATFPDEAVAWLDAVVVLTADKPVFPPLLGGAGGVLGSMDLSSNFMEHLAGVLRLPFSQQALSVARVRELVQHSLLADRSPSLLTASSGLFNPGATVGVTSSPTGAESKLMNPWDYIFLLEGSLLFASGAARRLGAGAHGTAAMPFMVTSSPVGHSSAAAGESAHEVWAPVWRQPTTSTELARLLGEGRSAWDRSQARTGLDFVRAVASLGTDRGIDHFVRHVVVQRLGQSNLAVPVGRVKVQAKPEVPVLAALDPWVARIRRARNVPAGVAAALRRLDAAQFDVSVRGGAPRLQEALIAAAELEALVARSPALRDENVRQPLQGLSAAEWLPVLDDGTPELRLAAAIASQRDASTPGQPLSDFDRRSSSPTLYLRPVRRASAWTLEWTRQPARVAGHGHRPILDVLAQLLARRAVDVASRSEAGGDHDGQIGVQPAFHHGLRTPLADVAALVEGQLDEARLDRHLAGLLLLNWRSDGTKVDTSHWHSSAGRLERPAPPLWALLAPFFHGRPLDPGDGMLHALRPASTWPALLVAGRAGDVAEDALLRLRIAHLHPAPLSASALAATTDAGAGLRLAAALMCPLSAGGASALLRRTVPDPLERSLVAFPEQEPPHA